VNILVVFFAGMFVLTVLFVAVLLLAGFRPQRSTRSRRRSYGGSGGTGDGSGGTTP
jgi:hypothetical protein